MGEDYILEINEVVPRLGEICFQKPINWKIRRKQHWSIIGANGAGKTLLTDILIGKYALKSGEIIIENNKTKAQYIKSVSFRDIYSLSDIQNSYYQQRWNAGDVHEVPVVSDLLKKTDDEVWLQFLVEIFGINDLLDKEINLLSSGELRKMLIIKSLLLKPGLLILDNPYIGLDTDSRIVLNDVFSKIISLQSIQLVLVLCNPTDIPEMITDVLPLKDRDLLPPMSRSAFLKDEQFQNKLFSTSNEIDIPSQSGSADNTFENALSFTNIFVKYGNRIILKELNWKVKRGDKWALLGKNGSGKSTLLSLVCADNPQAYANQIELFDRKRGSGESIWDIKKRIGYVSPEMHLYYLKNVKCLDVVGSGFFDTVGLYRKCTEEQEKVAEYWMQIFGVLHLKDRPFLQISTGEQRLVLLARVFVKEPDLLILDEPLHGLDINNKQKVKKIIEDFCNDNKSLIYVTHYENEIPSVVDKRLVLEKQR
ncbi:MAG: ATP-binding cassette domain-containing protein [Dysgonomonas sp.]